MTGFGEFDLIRELLAPLSGEGAFGLTDDAAVLPKLKHGEAWTVTKDAMVEGVHFLPDSDASTLARKLLRVNLSDLASMGARPVGYFLSLSLSDRQGRAWLTAFCDGLALDQTEFAVALYGGDTTSTPGPLSLSLTAMGAVTRGAELRRNGARAGDTVCVSGPLGGAALGLRALTGALDPTGLPNAVRCYELPEPQIALGQALVGVATACADISDGLVADLGHIARQSGLGARISCKAIPVLPELADAMARDPSLAELPLNGGDDYELVFTLPPTVTPPPGATPIGTIVEGEGVEVLKDGRPLSLSEGGWRHF